jgi:hypothetical protein
MFSKSLRRFSYVIFIEEYRRPYLVTLLGIWYDSFDEGSAHPRSLSTQDRTQRNEYKSKPRAEF